MLPSPPLPLPPPQLTTLAAVTSLSFLSAVSLMYSFSEELVEPVAAAAAEGDFKKEEG